MSILTAWSPFFHSSARMRGRAQFSNERVQRVPPADEDELVRAHVQDPDEQHLVTIRQDEQRAEAECTCPPFEKGAYCKHIWAVLLDIQHRDGPGASADQLARLRVRAPKARKRTGAGGAGRRPGRNTEPEWMGRLSLLRPATAITPEATAAQSGLPVQRQVCYVVLPDASMRHQGLVVELRQRTPTATGWSKAKPLKIDSQGLSLLADPIDRELCALLLGGAPPAHEGLIGNSLGGRGEATYRLPPGAWRTILQRMIATGRCFIGDDAEDSSAEASGGAGGDRPLRWAGGQPWTLWMVGRESDNGPAGGPSEGSSEGPPSEGASGGEELLVHVELRRSDDEPPLPIEEPTMVLGGMDGVVIWNDTAAPLDDRDAYRWVGHFRDEQRRRDEPRPIRVPKADIERFLDRLYMLPELPEIDLPEGIGRVPQHVDPVPHLDLFSPGSREAQQVLPASAKNQLVAKVWFAYDDQRVSPVQPGRFVTISSSASMNAGADLGEGEDESEGDATTEEASAQAQQQEQQSAAHTASRAAGGETALHEWGDHPAIASNSANGQTDDDASPDEADEPDESDEAVAPVEDETGEDEQATDASSTSSETEGPPPEGLLIQRNKRAEREAMAQLAAQGLRPLSGVGPDTLALPTKQMSETVATLLNQGWEVSADRQLVRHAAAPSVSVTSGVDWFELRGSVRYQRADGTMQDVPLPQILNAARQGEQMVELDDGTQGLLPDQWLDEHGMLTAMGQLKGDHLRFRTSQAALLDALLHERELVEVDEPFEQLRLRLHQFRGVQPIEPTGDFKGSLRPYQREGLGWMALLRWFGMGGVLADDMGLGKTIQVLAMLQMRAHETRKPTPDCSESASESPDGAADPDLRQASGPAGEGGEKPRTHRPSLVIAPRSVVFNWVDEAEKFTDDLRVMAYAGGEREALREVFDEHDIIVTSYGLLRRDIEALREFEFDYLILDEAQAIKNPQSQAAKSARLLDGAHRLALTGTPVENHLGDLWSIFEFLNPGMLGASARFGELVRAGTQAASGNGNQADGQSEHDTLEQVGRALRPFILRRTKKQVLADLPDKTEQTLRCEMEPAQRKIYEDLRAYYRSHLLTKLDQTSGAGEGRAGSGGGPAIGGKAGFMVLEALLRLRQAACHPGLINDDYANEPSAKLDVLMDLLEDVSAEGSKALIFSQFTSMLNLVKQRFEERNVRYCYLDGQTRNRREVVHRFQTDPRINAFLVSLKTGGFGLNLTAAEYVFILDPWWNPAVEQQAIDRTHRIGQTRRVFAYRLICQDTVEQRITDLQAQKKQIADAIVGGEQHMLSNLTRDDLEQLLS